MMHKISIHCDLWTALLYFLVLLTVNHLHLLHCLGIFEMLFYIRLDLVNNIFISGEQLHILACLSACKRETEIITPFKVAAVMSRNGMRNFPEKENGNVEGGTDRVSIEGEVSPDDQVIDKSVENLAKKKIDPQKDVTASESLLRMEDHKRQTERLLKKFKNSHFFVRIAESDEQLWSKKSASKTAPDSGELDDQKSKSNESKNSSKDRSRLNAVIDRGNFDANISGGVARNTVKCYALCNGDIAVCVTYLLHCL